MNYYVGTKDALDRRRRRIQRMKKGIVCVLGLLLVLPTVLSVYVLTRLNTLEQKVSQLYEAQIEVKTAEKLASKTAVTAVDIQEVSLQAEYITEPTETVNNEKELEEEEIFQEAKPWPYKVYLTFDDGPSYYTQRILDILEEYDVKATFFVVGKEELSMQEMYQKIVDAGHTIGMHSYSHQYAKLYKSKESFLEDMDRLSSLIYNKTGVTPIFYRFPGGSSNTVSTVSMYDLIGSLNTRGITYFDWNVTSGDAGGEKLDADKIVQNVLSGMEKHEEAMILFHDTGDKATTVEALPLLIESLQERGISIAAIDEDTAPIQHIPSTSMQE